MFENIIKSSCATSFYFVVSESRALHRHAMQQIKIKADVRLAKISIIVTEVSD